MMALNDNGYKPIICVDFDGVVHMYTSGWQGPAMIPDEPVPGAVGWMQDMADEGFHVAIYSSRSHSVHGRDAMRKFVAKHWREVLGNQRHEEVSFPTEKPPAVLYIDDRGFQFKGEFPAAEYVRNFKPWNKE